MYIVVKKLFDHFKINGLTWSIWVVSDKNVSKLQTKVRTELVPATEISRIAAIADAKLIVGKRIDSS